MILVYAKKKALTLKKSTKSTPAHQKKVSHRKKAQKSTMVPLKALTTIPAFFGSENLLGGGGNVPFYPIFGQFSFNFGIL